MRQNYLKNAAILTVSGLALRLAGMLLRVCLANALGGEGIGLYELILAFYSVFITLATSGVSVAAARLVTEELSRTDGAAGVRGMMRCVLAVSLTLGLAAAALQAALARPAAVWWLGDARAAPAILAAAPSLPFMAAAAALRGFFLARRRVTPNALSQLAEEACRIALVLWLLQRTQGAALSVRCAAVLCGSSLSEMVSALLMLGFYGGEVHRLYGRIPAAGPPRAAARLWEILWPVEGARCLSSGLRTAENMLVPACLAVYLAQAGGRARAVEQYGILKGMALPLLFFPFGLLNTLATLLMPEITEAHVRGRQTQLLRLLDRMLTLTMYASVLAGALLGLFAVPLTQLLYHNAEAGFYLAVLAPVMPLMYLESMVDGAMKGLNEQKAGFSYTACDAVLRIAGVALLLPRFGMKGFLFVMICSNFYTSLMNFRRLLQVTRLPLHAGRWLLGPAAAVLPAAAAGMGAAAVLQPGGSIVSLLGGAAAMTAVYAAAGWLLGLGEAVRGLRRRGGKEIEKTD